MADAPFLDLHRQPLGWTGDEPKRRRRTLYCWCYPCPPESDEFEWIHSARANEPRGPISTGPSIAPEVMLGTLRDL